MADMEPCGQQLDPPPPGWVIPKKRVRPPTCNRPVGHQGDHAQFSARWVKEAEWPR